MVDVVADVRAKYVTFDEIEALDGSDAFFTNVNSPTDL
jgi:molybdopterin-guanine dinucleotide biosynthesis protein A